MAMSQEKRIEALDALVDSETLADVLIAYRRQRKAKGAFVVTDSIRITERLRTLFAEPYMIHGRMASGRPATMLNHRWRDMRGAQA